MRGPLALALCFSATSAFGLVGNAPIAGGSRSAVMIVGSGGTFCTGTAIAPDLVLTAAHCIHPGSEYKLVEFDAARNVHLLDIQTVARHPQFNLNMLLAHRATADVALLKLVRPLPSPIVPTTIGVSQRPPNPGDPFTVMGYGVSVRGDGKTSGTLREAALVATGKPGNLQVRLFDPSARNERSGLGACTGDSGGAVISYGQIVGIVSWSTGPKNSDGCGGLTGTTPLALYRDWIVEQAKRMNSVVAK